MMCWLSNDRDFRRALLPAALFITTLGLLGGAIPSNAQDFERYVPKPLPNTEADPKLPDLPKPAAGSDKVLIEQLKGLVFIDHQDKIKQPPPEVSGINIDESSDLPLLHSSAFHQLVQPYLGQPVSLLRLNEISRQIILFYRRQGLPVVDVYVPDQEISTGVVQIVVNEARVGKVEVVDACYFDPCILADQICIQPGDQIYESVVIDDLKWLNRNPFREVDLELSPGDQPGETDVIFKVRDRFPWRYYMGYEDTGTELTQLERMFFGVNWGNAFFRDDQLAYQFTPSLDFDSLKAHSLVYSKALLNRDIVQAFASYATSSADGLAPFNVDGEVWQASMRYYYNYCPEPCYEHYLVFGFDYKQTDNDLDFGGITVSNTDADIAQLMMGYHRYQRDRWGYWDVNVEGFFSPGGFSSGNSNAAFQTIRAFAKADYIYAHASFDRQVELGSLFYFLGRVEGQAADANLLPSEQLGFGGYTSIRGYDMRLVNGDSGYFFNLELHTQPITLGLDCCGEDELEFLGFFDYGTRYQHDLLPGEARSLTLSSLGVGMRYQIIQRLSLRLDYGWQLRNVPGDQKSGRVHLGLVVSY